MSTPIAVAPRKLFCFGFGYSAQLLAHQLAGLGFDIAGTRRTIAADPGPVPLAAFDGTHPGPHVSDLLAETTHVLISIPPGREGDLVLLHHADTLAALPSLKWIGYLSTVGVYGDAGGGWVDETTPVQPASERGRRRVIAEAAWQAFGQRIGKRVDIFRLPGIYGPGRSSIDAVRAGTARRIIKANQFFNRIHVADIAGTLRQAMLRAADNRSPEHSIFNVTDNEPSPPQDVVSFAAELLGLPPPPEQPFETANLSVMARSFYGESKRVSNARMKSQLEVTLLYPTYRDGLRAIIRCG